MKQSMNKQKKLLNLGGKSTLMGGEASNKNIIQGPTRRAYAESNILAMRSLQWAQIGASANQLLHHNVGAKNTNAYIVWEELMSTSRAKAGQLDNTSCKLIDTLT